jgi:hypothetical protein
MVSSGLLRRVARRNNPEDTILHSHRRENLKSYVVGKDLDIFPLGVVSLNYIYAFNCK